MSGNNTIKLKPTQNSRLRDFFKARDNKMTTISNNEKSRLKFNFSRLFFAAKLKCINHIKMLGVKSFDICVCFEQAALE